MSITRYDPVHESLSLKRAMDQLFEQSFIRPRGLFGLAEEETAFAPMDVCETDNGYEVYMALPGVKPDDVELTVQQNILTVRGRLCAPKGEAAQRAEKGTHKQERQNWIIQEMSCGTFQRSVTFDRAVDVDNIRTSFKDGLLTIFLPVSQASMPKRISLSQGQSKPVHADSKQ
jgi:HSP20 family protein